jgi:hypothetical protein
MEKKTSQIWLGSPAVQSVSHQGGTDGSQVRSRLVQNSRHQLHFDQGGIRVPGQDAKDRLRWASLAAMEVGYYSIPPVLERHLHYARVGDRPGHQP